MIFLSNMGFAAAPCCLYIPMLPCMYWRCAPGVFRNVAAAAAVCIRACCIHVADASPCFVTWLVTGDMIFMLGVLGELCAEKKCCVHSDSVIYVVKLIFCMHTAAQPISKKNCGPCKSASALISDMSHEWFDQAFVRLEGVQKCDPRLRVAL